MFHALFAVLLLAGAVVAQNTALDDFCDQGLSNTKCETDSTTVTIEGVSLPDCAQEAQSNGHQYFSFNPNNGKCYSTPTCASPTTGTGSPWVVYKSCSECEDIPVDVIIVLDTSSSMVIGTDGEYDNSAWTDQQAVAKAFASEFASNFINDLRIGLGRFGNDANLELAIGPYDQPTFDRAVDSLVEPQHDGNYEFTATDAAMELGSTTLVDTSRELVFVMVTDGNPTRCPTADSTTIEICKQSTRFSGTNESKQEGLEAAENQALVQGAIVTDKALSVIFGAGPGVNADFIVSLASPEYGYIADNFTQLLDMIDTVVGEICDTGVGGADPHFTTPQGEKFDLKASAGNVVNLVEVPGHFGLQAKLSGESGSAWMRTLDLWVYDHKFEFRAGNFQQTVDQLKHVFDGQYPVSEDEHDLQEEMDGLNNADMDCWWQCSKSGPCAFCGNGKCCRKGYHGGEDGCEASEGGEGRHVCIADSSAQSIPAQKNAFVKSHVDVTGMVGHDLSDKLKANHIGVKLDFDGFSVKIWNRGTYFDFEFDTTGCRDEFRGVLGETYRCSNNLITDGEYATMRKSEGITKFGADLKKLKQRQFKKGARKIEKIAREIEELGNI